MSISVDIKKKLGAFQLNVSFQAQDEILALLGASGSGKSMTLKCIAGVEKPDAGRIVLDGRVLFDSEKNINLSPQKRKTGYLFQNYALFPNMTVEENIAAGITAPKREKGTIIAEKMKAFCLEGLGKHYPSQISGGQQQRVALARILVSEPHILMLDEPFSALDSYLRWQMEQEMVNVLEKFAGTTLLVSHNRNEVYRLCDRIAVMSNGKLEVISDKHSLFENPQTLAATLITGCKNISKAQKLSDYTLKALDWNTVLTTEQKIPEGLQYVGIRAHYFIPFIPTKDPAPGNIIKGKIAQVTEDTFSIIVMVQCESEQDSPSCIRWEMDKQAYREFGKDQNTVFLKVLPKDILLMSS